MIIMEVDNKHKYRSDDYGESVDVYNVSGESYEEALFWDLPEEAISLDDFGYEVERRSGVPGYMHHLKNYIQGCLIGKEELTDKDRELAITIKETVQGIDELIE